MTWIILVACSTLSVEELLERRDLRALRADRRTLGPGLVWFFGFNFGSEGRVCYSPIRNTKVVYVHQGVRGANLLDDPVNALLFEQDMPCEETEGDEFVADGTLACLCALGWMRCFRCGEIYKI